MAFAAIGVPVPSMHRVKTVWCEYFLGVTRQVALTLLCLSVVDPQSECLLLLLHGAAGYNPDGRRGLIGTIPNSISNLQHLKRLGLRTNALTGSIPESLCHPGILSIDLKGNSLYGDIGQFLRCTDLQYLDISNNRFAGTLPDIPYWGWEQMFVLEANDNRIEGTLPAAFYKLPELFSVALAKNR